MRIWFDFVKCTIKRGKNRNLAIPIGGMGKTGNEKSAAAAAAREQK